MKKTISIILIMVLCFTLFSGCGKSEAVKAAEEAIASIGEVTLESKETIANAEKLYGLLTDEEKSKVDNRLVLVNAKEAFTQVQGKIVFDNAKEAYEKLNEVVSICESGMDDLYGAWYFGIYQASEYSNNEDMFYKAFAFEMPNISEEELINAVEEVDTSYSLLSKSWEACLLIAQVAVILRGDHDEVSDKLLEAENILQELTDEYDDYTYYPHMKEYYSAVSSYAEFYYNPTGSFEQLSQTINGFENTIRTYQHDIGFLFTK